jgi:hypothetical protein
MLLAGAPISVLLKWICHIYFMNAILEEWLPEGHMARFVVEIIHKLDLRKH